MKNVLLVAALIFIAYIGYAVRTLQIPDTVADYDPWWYYRHSVDVLNYGFFNIPKWDILSYYPPGRPYETHEGLEFVVVFFYKIITNFIKISFQQFYIIAPAVVAGLSGITAYMATRYISGSKIAGLFAGFFAVLAPSFISYSVSGYFDSKALVVFYSFFSIFSLMLAMKKKSIPFYILAVFVNVMFIFTWAIGGWYPLMSFLFLLPAVFIFRILEEVIHKKSLKVDMVPIYQELKSLSIPFLIIMIAINIITQIFLSENILQNIYYGLGFVGIRENLIVNISVAELQPINILSLDGFSRVAGQVGFLPTILTLPGLFLLILYKIYKKEKMLFQEIFLFLFAMVSFYMILKGVRFALIFSVASSLSAGYFIANLYHYLKKNHILTASFIAVMFISSIFLFSDSVAIAKQVSSGYAVSQNWKQAFQWFTNYADKDSLIVTWWDPGHIITGNTGLKVMADGAHCGPDSCKPYDHNIRIQDMGRVFSISDEEQAIKILQKYMSLTPEQCQKVRDTFGSVVPKNACDPVSEMYLIASSDLIGKYYWLSYFGTGTGTNFIQLPFSNQDQSGNPVYGGIITLGFRDNKVVPVINVPQQGITNSIIKEVVYFQQGSEINVSYANVSNTVDGLLWIDPSFQSVIFMSPEIRDSIFTKLFFFEGQGLDHFKQVFSNGEVKIYKVIF